MRRSLYFTPGASLTLFTFISIFFATQHALASQPPGHASGRQFFNPFAPVSQQLKDPKAAEVTIIAHVLEPKKISVNNVVHKISLPNGFDINVFARDLINPRMIAVASNGRVYVTRRSVGDVVMLQDTDGDGEADLQEIVANRPGMHGIAISGHTLFLATVKDIYRATILSNGRLSPLEHIVNDLPDGGQHPNRTLSMGPDERLYVSVGSTCNACDETSPESATILQMKPDGSSRRIFASGLRNTIGFSFEPETREMYGMDNGIDWLGDNEQYEELNHIVEGKRYGWPYIYDDSKFNPQDEPPGDITLAEWAARSVEPLGFYTPHAAPMQMTFYTGHQFPAEYRGDAFVAMRGSWNRKPPSGYEVARIRFEDGRPVGFEAFAQGFLSRIGHKWVHRGRLAGMAQAPDGALLVADDTNGVIYRISYTGSDNNRRQPRAPTNSRYTDIRVVDAPSPEPDGDTAGDLAIELSGQEASPTLTSPAFAQGNPLPTIYAAEGEDISPPLRWTPGPDGTESYVLIMEDPDVAENPPFVHWLLYNIPVGITELEQGVPPLPTLAKLSGALQGKNDRGAIGYFGPMPPTSDPSHRYYFQLFALSKKLSIPFGATRYQVIEAMRGHVLASEYLVGTYER